MLHQHKIQYSPSHKSTKLDKHVIKPTNGCTKLLNYTFVPYLSSVWG